VTNVSLIVARARNGVIGRQGELPWHVGDDLRHFRRVTLGNTVILGRKTYDSLRTALTGRRVIVLSRRTFRPVYPYDHVQVMGSLTAAILAGYAYGTREIVICGGAEVYKQGLRFADRVYLTTVDVKPKGDAFFKHRLAPWNWRETGREYIYPRQDRNDHSAVVQTFQHRWRRPLEQQERADDYP
jgi:dihydrofolate reductase